MNARAADLNQPVVSPRRLVARHAAERYSGSSNRVVHGHRITRQLLQSRPDGVDIKLGGDHLAVPSPMGSENLACRTDDPPKRNSK